MELTKHAEELLKKSYYRKDKDGKVIENWEGLCRRVAKHIVKGDYCDKYSLRLPKEIISYTEHLYKRKDVSDRYCCGTCHNYEDCPPRKAIEDKFFDLLYNQYFIVNTPSLMNSGTELGGLSACYIYPIEDSMESILDAVKKSGMILKTGGGVGVSFAKVRQKGAKVGSTGGVSSGVISWLKIFNQVVEEVKQGGRRRGAMSATLPVNHPDILEFIKCKTENTAITNFNISVGITDEFMQKVKNNEDYDLIEPHTGKVVQTISAVAIFNTVAEQAFKNGEPGLLFLDRVNKDNPVPKMGEILSGNPCQEYTAIPLSSCTLGAVNLSKIIDIERWGNGTPLVRAVENVKVLDYKLFDSIISTAVRMLDNTITMNKFPIPEIEEVTLANRPIGLGFLNLSELFIKLGLVYGSDESLEMAETVTSYMRKKAIETSIELAKERGSYPNYNFDDWFAVNSNYYNRYPVPTIDLSIPYSHPPVRNSTVLSIAPNGSTGVIVNASSGGVEPIFAVSYKRKTVDCGDMHMVNPLFEEMMFPPNKESIENTPMGSYQLEREMLLSAIEDNAGSVKGISDVPEKIQKLFVTAREIPYEQHIKMQAKIQNSVDLSISKTISLFADATITDVKNAYTMAHELNCKGITIYREGSRENEVLSTKKKTEVTSMGTKELILSNNHTTEELIENLWGKIVPGTQKIDMGYVAKVLNDSLGIELHKDSKESGVISESKMCITQDDIDKKTKEAMQQAFNELKSLSPEEFREELDNIPIGEEETYEDEYDYIVEPRERKDTVVGYTYKISLHGMKVYITINFNEDEMTPIETFILAGKPGDDINAIAQSIGRLVSLSLKFKVPIDEIMQQIDSMAGDEIVWMGGDKILSIPDAVAKALKWAMKKRKDVLGSQPIYYPEKTEKFQKISQIKECPQKELKDSKEIKTFLGNNKCPNCGDTLVFQEGCRKCLSCDYNKCG